MTKLPITHPGIYADIPLETYHSAEVAAGHTVSSSGLRKLWTTSPAHFYSTWECNPNRVERESTAALELGSMAHHLLLGEDDFSLRYICHPAEMPDAKGVLKSWSMQLNSAKAWKAEQEAAGRIVITPGQLERVRGMARSLAAHPLIEAGALRGDIEQTMISIDEETGLYLRARPDAIPTDSGVFCDLKTCESVTDFALKMTLRNWGYPMQAGLTWEIAEALSIPFDMWTLVFVESEPPHCVRAITLADDDVGRGRRQNRAMLRLIARCIERNEWPAPGGADAEPMSLPVSEREFIDKRLDQLESEMREAA